MQLRPVRTIRLVRRFLRLMPLRDVIYVIFKAFLGKRRGATPAETLSRAVAYPELKDAAAAFTQVPDATLGQPLAASEARPA